MERITIVYSKDDPALTCNKAYDGESFTTETVADANPGSTINIKWNRWPSDHKGPITTYAARCGDTREACNGFQAKDVVWFKIDEAGYDINAGTWATDTLIQGGDVWTFQLPNNIQQGAYLIRHEILALHSQGAPQWYPHCFAVYLSWGNGPLQGTPVSIPGTVYSTPEDDQALFGSIYDTQAVQQMKIPGPALVQKRDIVLEDDSESVQRRHAHTRKHLH